MNGPQRKTGTVPLMLAYTSIAADLRAVNAADRQLTGLAAWALLTHAALTAAAKVPGASQGLQCVTYGAGTHKAWGASTNSILAALKAQESQADIIRAQAEAAARAAETRAGYQRAMRAAADAMRWQQAAALAWQSGIAMVAIEGRIHLPVASVVHAAGIREVTRAKGYYEGARA